MNIMKRLNAFLNGKVASLKAVNREKKVNSAINASVIDFEEQRDNATIEIESLTESLATCESVNKVLQEISDQIEAKEEAERGIERMKKIKDYFDEDIEVGE